MTPSQLYIRCTKLYFEYCSLRLISIKGEIDFLSSKEYRMFMKSHEFREDGGNIKSFKVIYTLKITSKIGFDNFTQFQKNL